MIACMRTISSTASSATIMALRVSQISKNSISDTASSLCVSRRAQPVHHLRDGHRLVPQLEFRHFLAPLEDLLERLHQIDERNDHLALDRVARVERAIRPRPNVILDLLLLIQQLRGVLEFLVFEQPVNQLVARIFQRIGPGERIGRQQHLRFDVDQRRGHVDEIGGDVDIELFELVEVIEILLGDFRDGNVVDVHLLPANQIEQEIERSFVHRQIDAIG